VEVYRPGRPGEFDFVELVAAYCGRRGGHLLVWCWCCRSPAERAAPLARGRPSRRAAERETAKPPQRPRWNHRPCESSSPDRRFTTCPTNRAISSRFFDFKYQDFVELYKLKNQLERRDEPPRSACSG